MGKRVDGEKNSSPISNRISVNMENACSMRREEYFTNWQRNREEYTSAIKLAAHVYICVRLSFSPEVRNFTSPGVGTMGVYGGVT